MSCYHAESLLQPLFKLKTRLMVCVEKKIRGMTVSWAGYICYLTIQQHRGQWFWCISSRHADPPEDPNLSALCILHLVLPRTPPPPLPRLNQHVTSIPPLCHSGVPSESICTSGSHPCRADISFFVCLLLSDSQWCEPGQELSLLFWSCCNRKKGQSMA